MSSSARSFLLLAGYLDSAVADLVRAFLRGDEAGWQSCRERIRFWRATQRAQAAELIGAGCEVAS